MTSIYHEVTVCKEKNAVRPSFVAAEMHSLGTNMKAEPGCVLHFGFEPKPAPHHNRFGVTIHLNLLFFYTVKRTISGPG